MRIYPSCVCRLTNEEDKWCSFVLVGEGRRTGGDRSLRCPRYSVEFDLFNLQKIHFVCKCNCWTLFVMQYQLAGGGYVIIWIHFAIQIYSSSQPHLHTTIIIDAHICLDEHPILLWNISREIHCSNRISIVYFGPISIKSCSKIKIKPMPLNLCNERYFSNDRNWNEYTNASLCVYYHKNSNENLCLLYARFMWCLHLVECEFWSGDLNFWIGLKCNYIRSKSLFLTFIVTISSAFNAFNAFLLKETTAIFHGSF